MTQFRRFPSSHAVATFADLRATAGEASEVLTAAGRATAGDGFEGAFVWIFGTATDDDLNFLIGPSGSGGYWKRLDLGNGVIGLLSGSFSFADLRLTSADAGDMANCYGRSVAGEGAEGQFVWNVGVATDNDGTILVGPAGSGGFWSRQISRGVFDSRWFGIKADNSTDNTVALQALLDVAKANLGTSSASSVYLPSGVILSGALTLDLTAHAFKGFYMFGDADSISQGSQTNLRYIGAAQGTLLTVIGSSQISFERIFFDGNYLTKRTVWLKPQTLPVLVGQFALRFRECVWGGMGDYVGSCGVAVGDAAQPNIQVSEGYWIDCTWVGNPDAINDQIGWKTETVGNVKNFWFQNCKAVALKKAIDWGNSAGVLCWRDGYLSLNKVDFTVGSDCHLLIESCGSEGSAMFVDGSESIGNSRQFISIRDSYWDGLTPSASPTNPVIKFANTLRIECTELVNNAGAWEPYIRTGAPQMSFFSKGNWYYGSKSLPLIASSLRLIGDASGAVASEGDDVWQYPGASQTIGATVYSKHFPVIESVGDQGVNSGVTMLFPSVLNPPPVHYESGLSTKDVWRDQPTDYSIHSTGETRTAWAKWSIPHTAFKSAGLSLTLRIGNVWKRTIVHRAIIDITTAFTGVAGLNMTLGLDATINQLLLAFNPAVAGQYGKVDADLGPGLARATAVQGGIWSWTSAANMVTDRNQITVSVSGATNLGTGSVTNLTAGVAEIYVQFDILP